MIQATIKTLRKKEGPPNRSEVEYLLHMHKAGSLSLSITEIKEANTKARQVKPAGNPFSWVADTGGLLQDLKPAKYNTVNFRTLGSI